MKSIVVEITKDSEVTVEAVGFKGNACEKATAAIEQALGKTKSSTKKPEFYQANVTTQKVGR